MKQKAFVSKTGVAKKKVTSKSSNENLGHIFEGLLRDIYWAEKYLVKVLPKMAKAAHNEDLQEAFESHLEQTVRQVERIEKCFELLDLRSVGKKCPAMEGLVKEGTEIIEEYDMGHARDAGLIAAAQKIEHYEISSYGTLRTIANVLGKMQCAELLEETKDEEAETDEHLTALAARINQMAAEIEVQQVQVEEVA